MNESFIYMINSFTLTENQWFQQIVMTNSNQFYEGCGQEGPIRCIFLSEFHDTAGSKITCQVKKLVWVNQSMKTPNPCTNCIIVSFRLPITMYQRRCLMPLTFTSSQSHSYKDACSPCKWNAPQIPLISLGYRNWFQYSIAETSWATKLSDIPYASNIPDTLEMHSTLISVLYVIPGHVPCNMNPLCGSCRSTL